jgi:hypothetical protein
LIPSNHIPQRSQPSSNVCYYIRGFALFLLSLVTSKPPDAERNLGIKWGTLSTLKIYTVIVSNSDKFSEQIYRRIFLSSNIHSLHPWLGYVFMLITALDRITSVSVSH